LLAVAVACLHLWLDKRALSSDSHLHALLVLMFIAAARATMQAGKMAELQAQLESQVAATRQAEANAKEAEGKAASQATLAAAARAEVSSRDFAF
jgi:cell division protein FtsB